MRKLVASIAATTALCLPAIASAKHTDIPMSMMTMEYGSMEECEDALAEYRNMQRKARYKGREAGMYNKDFNARYQCVEMQDGMYMIDDMNN